MRDTLKESLMKQWELESARKEQMGALAHDLKTPLTVIRGNVQLMGEQRVWKKHKSTALHWNRKFRESKNICRFCRR